MSMASSSSAGRTKRSDSALASCSTTNDSPSPFLHSPSCSHDDLTNTMSSKDKIDQTSTQIRGAIAKPRNVSTIEPNRDVGIRHSVSSASTKNAPLNVASMKQTESQLPHSIPARVPPVSAIASTRVSTHGASKDLASGSVESGGGIATVSGAALDRRQPPPVPARVFACITEETVHRKPKRKNFRPSPPQQRR